MAVTARAAVATSGVVLWAAALLGAPAPAMAADPTPLFRITDERITEASGIAVGRTSPGVVYVQNDSGDTNRFFAIDRSSGRTAAVVTVTGAENIDWEDIAVGPDADGTSSVWIGDIGVNTTRRDDVRVYRVDEPKIAPQARDIAVTTAPADVWRLRYPGSGPLNAESLAVGPDGTGYIVTKSERGNSQVYRIPPRPDPNRVQMLQRIGTIHFTFTGTPGRLGPPSELTATGAALSVDGRVLAVRTYTDAYVWRVTDGDVAAALRTTPARVAMPARQFGEGITIDGDALLVDAEGRDQFVYSIPLPGGISGSSPAPSSSGATRTGRPPIGVVDGSDDGLPTPLVATLIAVGGVLVVTGVALVVRRRRVRSGGTRAG